ncbi:MAG: hypothetical protein PHR68_02410 [Candidatus Gracilibacteria bacterium]|nr:hypothetical protein [Candidatus Gracilibacteria bacterium]
MRKSNSKKAYSVLLALLMTSFIIIIVSGVFKLILQNMYDTRGMQDYLKAYARAEGSMEIALKKVKDMGYGYEEHIFSNAGNNKINEIFYDGNKDAKIGYEINSRTGSIKNINLESNKYTIYPLYYTKADGTKQNITKLNFTINSGNPSFLVWNIIGEKGGISSTGSFSYNDEKQLKKIDTSNNFTFENLKIIDFLKSSEDNYLILYNSSNDLINYNLETIDSLEKFTLNNISIIAEGKVGDYKQNLQVNLNNSKNLNLLKYSILSGEN